MGAFALADAKGALPNARFRDAGGQGVVSPEGNGEVKFGHVADAATGRADKARHSPLRLGVDQAAQGRAQADPAPQVQRQHAGGAQAVRLLSGVQHGGGQQQQPGGVVAPGFDVGRGVLEAAEVVQQLGFGAASFEQQVGDLMHGAEVPAGAVVRGAQGNQRRVAPHQRVVLALPDPDAHVGGQSPEVGLVAVRGVNRLQMGGEVLEQVLVH